MPFVQNYLPENYGNHGKIWEMKSVQNGLTYLASENGLLEFDGETWNRFRDYRGFTRSLYLSNDSTIYIGADMDFGVYKKNKFQKFTYTSLYPYKKNSKETEEFWGTYQVNNKIVFVSHQNIYTYHQDKIKKIASPVRFSDSFFVDGTLFIADEKKGLFTFDGEKLKLVFNYPNEIPFEISGIFKQKNQLKIITKDNGIFQFSEGKLSIFSSEINSQIIENKVFSFSTIENKYWVFGTILNGLYITDLNGKIIQHFNKSKGLPNNTVLSIHYHENGKLWLGLDYGISVINIKDNITYFHDSKNDVGTGFAVALKNNIFYLGTNQGLYNANWNELTNNQTQNIFTLVPTSEGQVWTLQDIDGQLLCGHDKGLFEITGNQFKKIHNEPGVYSILKFRNHLLTASYNGISVFEKKEGSWQYLKKVNHIVGAVSQIVQENGNTFWANLPNYGILRFQLNENFEPQNRKVFFIENFSGSFPHIFVDKQGIHLVTNSAQYSFQDKNLKFVHEVFAHKSSKIKNIFPGFYRPIKLNEDYGFYPINNGFAVEDFGIRDQHLGFASKLLFRNALAFNNDESISIINGEMFPYRFHNLKFSFMMPNEDGVEYQYFLENFSEKWSDWNEKKTVEFLGLREGNYTLLIKARKNGNLSETVTFNFVIKAPWYRTFWSYLASALLLMAIIYSLRKYQQNKLKKQKLALLKKEQNSLREQAERHREMMILEKQKQLEQEKNALKNEVKNKTIELATKAKEDEDKNRLLHSLKEKIDEAEKNPSVSEKRWKEMRRLLNTYLEIDDKTFEIQMDELHQEFFKVMKKRFPNLSIYDLRLCAYLRIGLTSKEMADILQVLPSSINVSRSRLRKKLNLLHEDDLYDFLINLQ